MGMTKYDPKEVFTDFIELFGHVPTLKDAWFLAKLMKHARGRCINNVAFNNFMNACFPNLRFAQVTKVDPNDPNKLYEGLEITEKPEFRYQAEIAPVDCNKPLPPVENAPSSSELVDKRYKSAAHSNQQFLKTLFAGKIGTVDPFVHAAIEEQIKIAYKLMTESSNEKPQTTCDQHIGDEK